MYSYITALKLILRYEVMDDEDIYQTRLWTKSPIYFIIPAEVFQYASLLFNHHSLDGLVTNLTVKLPHECCNGTSNTNSSQCQTTCNNKYFDVLTNEVCYSCMVAEMGHQVLSLFKYHTLQCISLAKDINIH
jgi:hypothetical protein